jgi:hypothetical protein
VYYKNIEVVKKLISIECCDVNIRTKQDRLHEATPGMTPIEYAEYNKCFEISIILNNHKAKQKELSFPTFIPHNRGDEFINMDLLFLDIICISIPI